MFESKQAFAAATAALLIFAGTGCGEKIPVASTGEEPADRSAFLAGVRAEATDTTKVREFIDSFNKNQPERLRTGAFRVDYDKASDTYFVNGENHDVVVKLDASGNVMSATGERGEMQTELTAALGGTPFGYLAQEVKIAERSRDIEAAINAGLPEIPSHPDIDMSLPEYKKPEVSMYDESVLTKPTLTPLDPLSGAESDADSLPEIGSFGEGIESPNLSSSEMQAKRDAYADSRETVDKSKYTAISFGEEAK